jgi:hypothetical protein
MEKKKQIETRNYGQTSGSVAGQAGVWKAHNNWIVAAFRISLASIP